MVKKKAKNSGKSKNNNKKNNSNDKKKDDIHILSPQVNASNSQLKISILTVSQLKRISFLHNLSKMIQYQSGVTIHEWIITNGCVDDDEHDKFNEEIKKVICPTTNIKYVADKNLSYKFIGAFRNLANRNVSGDIIVCMDDDDFYFKDYVKSCYDILVNKKDIQLVGCSSMLMYDYGLNTVFRIKSFGPNHTVNCCLAYRKDYFKNNKYDETRKTGEEKSFLNNYMNKMEQLPVTSALIHMSYVDNTFNGKRLNMLNNMLGNFQNPKAVPQIYTPINSELKTLINNDEIYNCYMDNFIKLTNPKETDVTFYFGNFENEWSPTDNNLNVYRRKILEQSKILIDKGYTISVYGKFDFNELEYEGITFYNLRYFNVRTNFKYLIFIDYTGFTPICQHEKIFKKFKAQKIFVDLNCNLFNIANQIKEFHIDKIEFIFKNPYHIHMNPREFTDNFKLKIKNVVVPNGINTKLFSQNFNINREPKRFCYTSNYQNGLERILEFGWPIIRKNHPEAEFHIYYGFNRCSQELKDKLKTLMMQDGVYEHGRVSHEEIAKEMRRSSFLYYYTETGNDNDCMSVMEALHSGCVPLIWNKNIFSRFHGIICPLHPINQESHVKIANEISKVLDNDKERERILSQFKNSSTIISDNQSALILESAFNNKLLSNQQIGLSNNQPTVKNDLPSSIDLSKYIDSDSESDSESDIEYESDSEDENTKRDEKSKEYDDKDLKEIDNIFIMLKQILKNHPVVQTFEELSKADKEVDVKIFSSGKIIITKNNKLDNLISNYYNKIREKLAYSKFNPQELDNAIQEKFGDQIKREILVKI